MEVPIVWRQQTKQMVTEKPKDDFQAVFRSEYETVVRKIVRIVHDQATAEDIAQDVFMKLYHADRSTISNVSAWLFRVALHEAYNYIRTERRRMDREERHDGGSLTAPSSEERFFKQDDIAVVQHVLTEMEERDRTLLWMRYAGFSYQEVAEAVHVEPTSVGTLLARARRKFRTIYEHVRGNE